MRVISLYPDWDGVGGAQNVAMTLAKELNDSTPMVICTTPLNMIHPEYKNENVEFRVHSLKEFLSLRNDDVVLSHHRKLTSLYMILSYIFFWKRIKIVHVAHNTFSNLRWATILPPEIIAVSNGVKENLVSYFKINPKRIKVIFNGLYDRGENIKRRQSDECIKILLAGRVCPVKQQVRIVEELKGVLHDNIHIYFAGEGEDIVKLKKCIGDDSHFHVLGLINIHEHISEYDYIMLFSEKEGLGMTLVEACMYGKPMITNNLPAVLDIIENNVNGYVYSDFISLKENINMISHPNSKEYKIMAQNARNKYINYFTMQKMIKEYKDIIGLHI